MLLKLSIKCQKRTYGFFHLIKFFDQVKSLKKFGQLIMKLLINWKNTILIKWNSIMWSFPIFYIGNTSQTIYLLRYSYKIFFLNFISCFEKFALLIARETLRHNKNSQFVLTKNSYYFVKKQLIFCQNQLIFCQKHPFHIFDFHFDLILWGLLPAFG